MRLNSKEIEKIKFRFDVDELWSYSRIEKYKTSHYEYFLRYIKHEKPNGEIDSAYAPLGGVTHDILEKLYTGQIDYKDMFDEFNDMWTMNISVMDFKFNRSESEKNDSIKIKYYNNLEHFFKHHDMILYKVMNEKFVTTVISKADKIVFQGYIDAIYKDDNGNYNIIDWKTSTKYSGSSIKDHAAQLILYAAALHQMGIPFDKIKVGWNFIKYVNVNCLQINGKWKVSVIERCQIGEKLQNKVKTWLKKLGYDQESTDKYLEQMIVDNDIKCLPDDVREKFDISDCYVYLDDDLEQSFNFLRDEIIDIIHEIRHKEEEYRKSKDDHVWYDDDESLKKQSYYFTNLSEYSINQLKPYKEYLERHEQEKSDPFQMASSSKSSDDFSWLNDI